MDGRGWTGLIWTGLIWLASGIGWLSFTLITQQDRSHLGGKFEDSPDDDPEDGRSRHSPKRLLAPLILILVGGALLLWGIGIFDTEFPDERCCPGP